MAHPLDSAYQKLGRAAVHVQALDAETKLYLDTEPFLPVPEFHLDTGKHLLRARAGGSPPPMLGAIAADAIHNLRSALDYLTYRAAGLDAAVPRGKRTQYPIFDSPAKFNAAIPGRYLKGVPKQLWPMFRAGQPFQPGFALLSSIAYLDDRDKHRILDPMIAKVAGAELVALTDADSSPIIDVRGFDRQIELEDETVLLEFDTDVNNPEPLQIGTNFHYIMQFGERNGVSMDTIEIRQALKMVATILLRFRPAFAAGADLDALDLGSGVIPTYDAPPG